MSEPCGARKRQGGGVCKLPAGWGTPHPGTGPCKLHGGSTRTHRQAALEVAGRQALARLNLPPVADPLTELAKIAAEAVAWKDAMAGKVNELTSLRYEATGETSSGGEQLRAEVALWERALDRCEKFLVSMARLNIDERLAAIGEAQTAALFELLELYRDAAGVSRDQHRAGLTAIAERVA